MSAFQDVFTARDYQISLLKKAIDANTIIYLPTGSGKTYIALMLIKEFSHLLDLPLDSGGKRSVFLVNTVPLVAQQAKCIRSQTHIEKVGEYIGAKNVDNWTKDEWLNEISENQVLVMTCQIFVDILRHGYITMEIINVIILDECHHAVHDHPMHQLMQVYTSMENINKTRVLGLTASLLNSNCKPDKVMTEVRTLESTLHSKVATVEQMADVLGYSTNPHEKIETYQSPYLTDSMKYVIDLLNKDILRLKEYKDERLIPKKPFLKALKGGSPSLSKTIQNLFKDCEYHIATLGQYGGSLALLSHMIELEITKRKCSTASGIQMCTVAITSLATARRCLVQEMEGYSEKEKIYKYSTDKVKKLFTILKNYSTENTGTKLKGIVFVERRFTAKVLYHIIKQLASHDEDFVFIQPEFMVGLASKTMSPSLEGQLASKWTKDALAAFRTEKANLLVASNVVEEGLDVPRCSLVIRFDDVTTYCTYIQSKGRARDKDSMFYMMVPYAEYEKFNSKYRQFQEVANLLKNFLVGQNNNRTAPSKEEIENELEEIVDPYCTEIKACVTMVSSISLVNRYCSMLPHDRFTTLTVNYYEEEREIDEKFEFRVMLELPIVSSIKDMITGEWMLSKRDAKRIAALKACELLHKAGELNENLMPVQNSKKAHDLAEEDGLQDHWATEELTEDSFGQPLSSPGTKKRKRQHKKIIPKALLQTAPKIGETVYIHIIQVIPGYTKPNESENRLLRFYEMINDKQTYGIISSKPLPNLCDFPLFMGIGELKISIKNNYATTVLSLQQLHALRLFHTMLFRDVLEILKDFLIFNNSDDGVGYMIAPITANQTINWDVIQRFPELKTPASRPSSAERKEYNINPEDYHSAVVIPWYRTVGNRTAYIVTRVCCEMSPDTVFPTRQFESYRKYFQDKYHLITECEQPLLEVKPISFNKLNTLKPRSLKANKKKFTNDMDLTTFDEHLVPEFCYRLDYPAILYLKAAIIPSAIHRMTSLMRAHELIQSICTDLNLNPLLPLGVQIEPLKIDEEHEQRNAKKAESKTEIKKKQELSKSIDMFNDSTVDFDNAEKIQQNEVDNFVLAKKLVESEYPWDPTEEPMDIHRNIFEQTTIELDFYHKFVTNSFDNDDNLITMNYRSNQLAICYGPSESKLSILRANPGYIQLGDMLSVLTANSANDICDLERLEALGDSFLKVAVTTFLMMKYPTQNEGELTTLKCQIIGNKNLYYCAAFKEIPGQMNVFEFSPCEDWIPPGFKLPDKISDYILQKKISPEVLYEIVLPKNEVQEGVLKSNTMDSVMEILSNASPDNNSNSMENYFGLQTVNDKTSADCIEAMIGQYLKSFGIKTTLKLLGWLRVIPSSDLLTNLFDLKPPSALRRENTKSADIDCLLPGYRTLEGILQYKFKDRSYLLQALTHASYTPNRITDCYQRLEFLGDSVLDFLITCHIYENCGRLSPGEITDLRSALVNNITFASLAVRYGFHKYLLAFNPALQDAISKFVSHQTTRDHAIDEEVLYLLEETECNIAEYIDVPKVLGDLFESIAGAIFLDSGMNLEVVWKVFYRLMSKEIAMFSQDVPKQVVRVLYESNCLPCFGDIHVIENSNFIVMPLTFSYLGTMKKVYGLGINKQQAMKAAAKIALRFMKK